MTREQMIDQAVRRAFWRYRWPMRRYCKIFRPVLLAVGAEWHLLFDRPGAELRRRAEAA